MARRISISDSFEYIFSFDQEDVVKFSEATGDYNPIHLDNDFASKTIFKRTIIHGFLGGSVFSKIFGTMFPGEGTIYLKQEMSFFKPMFTMIDYQAKIEILEIFPEKNRARVKTTIFDNKGETIIDGEALIKHANIC